MRRLAMQRGIDTPPEIKAQALAVYAETFSTHKAEIKLREQGIIVDHSSIARWANEVDGLTTRMRLEQKQILADNWFAVASLGSERMVKVIEKLRDSQVAVPAAIATDKYLKLTEETPDHQGTKISVFVGVKVD